MEERSSKARRALHAMRGYAAQLAWDADKAEAGRLLHQFEALVDRVALRPGNTRERPAEEYTREDKIREELANDPHCYD